MAFGIRATDGTASAPTLAFANDTNSGFYRIGADNIGLSLGGTKRWDFGTAGSTLTGTLTVSGATTLSSTLGVSGVTTLAAGTAAAPSLSIGGSAPAFYRASATAVGIAIAADSTQIASFQQISSGVNVAMAMRVQQHSTAGTAANNPGFGFLQDTDTGVGLYGTDEVMFCAGGSAVLRSNATTTTIAGQLSLSGITTGTTVGAAGAASALPATPTGYITVTIAGTQRKIAYYAT